MRMASSIEGDLSMRAMILKTTAPLDRNPEPLELVDMPTPQPAAGEILVAISACGICHTELDEVEGRVTPGKLPVIPGHQVIGRVAQRGPDASRFQLGERVGVGWIHSSSGTDNENLSPEFRATGRDVHGGYAEFMVVSEGYAHRIPDKFDDIEAAPLLCAGGVGFRALRLCGLTDGQSLGLTGFGGSGHLVLQIARHLYPASPVYVFARSDKERQFALSLGAHWAGDTRERPPQLLDAIIDTTPAWLPVLAALRNLKPGGRLVINAIRKENADRELMASIDYAEHLWMEKELKTVANVTANDISEFLEVAAQIPIRPAVQAYPLEDANQALRDLQRGGLRGAKVLVIKNN